MLPTLLLHLVDRRADERVVRQLREIVPDDQRTAAPS